jgi:hypothetical protein
MDFWTKAARMCASVEISARGRSYPDVRPHVGWTGEHATRAVCGDALRAAYIQGQAPIGRGCLFVHAHHRQHGDW